MSDEQQAIDEIPGSVFDLEVIQISPLPVGIVQDLKKDTLFYCLLNAYALIFGVPKRFFDEEK